MAWIYLLITLAVFYLPIVGLGTWLVERDYQVMSIPMPFSGTVRLIVVSLLFWYVLWRVTLEIEGQMDIDFLSKIDSFTGLNLRARWLFARRPPLVHRLSRYLAGTLLGLCSVKLLGMVLAAFLLNYGFYWIAAQIPHLISARSWQALAFASLEQFTNNANDVLARWRIYPIWFSIALLVMTASRGLDAERSYRYKKELKEEQTKRKYNRRDVEISASGRD